MGKPILSPGRRGAAVRRLTVFAGAALLACAAAGAAEPARKSYVVQLVDKPAASYTGELPGMRGTRPAKGQRLDPDAAHVRAYVGYLENRKADLLRTIAAAPVTHRYNLVFNGFSALLTDDEVRQLKKNGAVAKISANKLMHTTTGYTSKFLGLDAPGGLWEKVGGPARAGEDVIIAMLDTGVWPENPAFADRVDADGTPVFEGGTQAYGPPPAHWKGGCETGQGFTSEHCNNKLIGARAFPPDAQLWNREYMSARDSDGHGTHTASTAGGAQGVPASAGGVEYGNVGGMAPRARLAIYKVCWTANYDGTGFENGCPTDSSVAAVEQAVRDGVNVISFSIGDRRGGGTFDEPTEQAFLGAANAGVFVSVSGGNQGPDSAAPAPVSHLSPWVTTVANSTHNRSYLGDATLGNGTRLTGASTNANTPAALLLLAKDAGKPGTSSDDPRLARCYGPEDETELLFDLDKVKGKILVCDRGGNILVNKAVNAKAAGAAGVIIVNVEGGATTLPSVSYPLSTLHLDLAAARQLKSYIAAAPGTASGALGDVRAIYDPAPTAAPVVAGSSSRGPNMADASIMKPDLSAPGTDILAGMVPAMTEEQFMAPFTGGTLAAPAWAFASGTSMAAPHVSGVAAMLHQLHPDWSPAAVKSALMTTAFATQSDGRAASMPWDGSALDTGKLPWAQGAGHIAPTAATDPGLVYDLGQEDYRRFLCGQDLTIAVDCSGVTPLDAADLNLPSLTAESVLGETELRRTVTNVGASTATYTATASLPGFKVEVRPATLTLAPGAKASFTVKLTRSDAPLHTWRYGALTWSDGTHRVASPLTARAAALRAPESLYSEAAAGSRAVVLRAGYTGAVSLAKGGLLPAVQKTGTVGRSTSGNTCPTPSAGLVVHPFTIAPGTLLARFALYNSDTSGGAASDLDLYLAKQDGTPVGSSGSASSDEMITLRDPAPGNYVVCVLGYAPQGGSATYKLSSWIVTPGATGGNLKVTAPAIVYPNRPATVGYSWSGLEEGKRYLGMVSYRFGGATEAGTLLEVDTTDPLPSFAGGRAADKPQY